MDANQILETIEKLPSSLKNFIYSSMISLTMATKNVNEEIFEVQAIPVETTQTQVKHSLSFLFHNDINNEQVAQYKKRFYSILKEADSIAEKQFGQTYFSKNLLNEENALFQRVNAKQADLAKNNIISLQNQVHLLNPYEVQTLGQAPKYDSKIKVSRNVNTDYKIEILADYLQIKPLNNNYELRFIIETGANKRINPNDINKLANFQYVNFFWKYEQQSYKIITYSNYEVKNNQLHIIFIGGKMENFEKA